MNDSPLPEEPANIKFLRRLVTTLTATMIIGLIVIIGLFVMRFSTQSVDFPRSIELPVGKTATAFTQSTDWFAVVTADNLILIFDRATGALRQTIEIK